jgi:SulP family sulfate permease
MNLNSLKGDLYGGITAAVIALPLALAFGVASGAGAIAGLYGAIVLGFFASLFGGTNTQISGPTGPMTVVIASAVAYFAGDFNAVLLVMLLAGLLQIVFGIFKLGQFVKYIPYPVISGFMSGIGIIIIILEINPFLGVESIGSVITTLIQIPAAFGQASIQAFALASLALAIMFFTPKKIATIIPPPLLAIIITTSLSVMLHLNVKTVGVIPLSLPELTIPQIDWSDLHKLEHIFSFAITLALLGVIDTLLTSLVADSVTKTKHKPNKELIGQGIGNSLTALVGGLAGAGATMRTVINIKSGGISRLSGMIHALTLLLIILFFAPVAAKIPLSVLAGILFKVGVDIVDYRFLKVMTKAPKMDMVIMLVVLGVTVFVNLIMAVGIGIVLASVLTVYRVTKEAQIDIQEHHGKDIEIDNNKIRVVNIDGAFFFGSASIFEERVSTALDVDGIVINCLNVPYMDVSAVFTLHEMILKMQENNIRVALILKNRHIEKIKNLIDSETLKKVNICQSLPECRLLDG